MKENIFCLLWLYKKKTPDDRLTDGHIAMSKNCINFDINHQPLCNISIKREYTRKLR